MDTANNPATELPDHFALAQERIGDLYPKYRDWTVTTMTLDVDYVVDTVSGLTNALLGASPTFECDERDMDITNIVGESVRSCALPEDYIGCILQSPDGQSRVFVMIPQLLLDLPTSIGPRVSVEELDAALDGEPVYLILPGTTTTACILKFKDGFSVMGVSACLARENFMWPLGKRLAYDRARADAFSVLAARKSQEIARLAAESLRA